MSTPRALTDAPFKAPARSLAHQTILEEDEYTAALSHIIARDFFPSLVHLDATNSYLDAVASADPALINASVRRLEELGSTPARAHRPSRTWRSPTATPFAAGPSETPLRTLTNGTDEPAAKQPRLDSSLRLDDFQTRYTSEDNASFSEILEDEAKRRREKYGWAYDAQQRVETQYGRMIEARERALVEAPFAPGVREKLRIETPVPAGLITAGLASTVEPGDDGSMGRETKSVVTTTVVNSTQASVDEEPETVDVMAPKKDTRPAGVDGWKFRARNSLMYPPDADKSPYDQQNTSAKQVVNSKVIKFDNTRLPEQEESTSVSRGASAPPSPTRSRIEAAIMGTPYRPRSPGVNNFSYVPAMPSPTPSELGPAAMKQLMTVGTLLSTPRVLSRSNDLAETPSTPFRIAEPTARETLSQRLASNASKSLRAKANLIGIGGGAGGITKRRGDMGPPSMTPRRAELTPAAKRLLDRTTMGTAATRRAEAMGRMAGWEGRRGKDLNKVRWTPTPGSMTEH